MAAAVINEELTKLELFDGKDYFSAKIDYRTSLQAIHHIIREWGYTSIHPFRVYHQSSGELIAYVSNQGKTHK